MLKVNSEITEKILEYIKLDIKKGLYIYIDLKKLGIDNNNLNIWVDDEDEINIVLMKYYTGGQIFTLKGEFDIEHIVNYIKDINVSILSGSEEIIRKLSPFFTSGYNIQYGYVAKFTGLITNVNDSLVKEAEIHELHDVATLICSDPNIGAHYELMSLVRQFESRKTQQFGRNKIIKVDNKIVAHAATYAEVDDIAIISGIITDKSMQNKGLGTIVTASLINELQKEGKEIYLYYYGHGLEYFYRRLGFEVCGRSGKITKLMNSHLTIGNE